MRHVHTTILAAVACALVAATSAIAAGGPVNDNRASATPLEGLPAAASGTTVGATEDTRDPRSGCGPTRGTVWYRLSGASSGRVVLRLAAAGDLDAIVSVYRAVRSRLVPVGCTATDENGRGALSFLADPGQSYLIMVGRERSSDDGKFRLTLFRQEPSSKAPGVRLPGRGVSSSVEAISDYDDAWSLRMRPGVEYRLNLSPARRRCVTLSLYAPGTRSFTAAAPLKVLHCGGYLTYTPGPGAGGRYGLLVTATDDQPGRERYHLQAAVAGPDDTAPGLTIRNLETRRGTISGTRIDVVDLYRFRVTGRSDVILTLAGPSAARLILIGENGRRLGTTDGPGQLSARLGPGRYFVVVRADSGAHGRYRLSLLERGITSTTVFVAGTRVAHVGQGSSVPVEVAVSAAAGGTVRLELDRFDPLTGWHFYRLYRLPLSGSGRAGISFRPPAIGHWRARASFGGTRTASPSSSGTALISVGD
jgi:hypothetical protein